MCISLAAFVAPDQLTLAARGEVVEQLARLPVPASWKIDALYTWADHVGCSPEPFEVAIVERGIRAWTYAAH